MPWRVQSAVHLDGAFHPEGDAIKRPADDATLAPLAALGRVVWEEERKKAPAGEKPAGDKPAGA